MPQATAQTAQILETARDLLRESMPLIQHKGITLVGISLANLRDDIPIQLALPFDEDRAVALDVALDDVRDRFGSASITRAVLVGKPPGITMPQLPD
jgi:DNA polymerase-4